MTTDADALPSQQQQRRSSSSQEKGAVSLAQQIRSFNRQQFAPTTAASSAHERPLDVEALLQDSDDDDDQLQQQQSDNGDSNGKRASAAHSVTGYESEDDVDEEEEAAFAMMNQLQLLQRRTVRKSNAVASTAAGGSQHEAHVVKRTQRTSVSAGMELSQAEERIATLEAQLLDAEEAICHLKAEKLAAFRDVERLTMALDKQQQVASLSGDDAASSNNQKSVNIWQMQSSSDEEKPEVNSDDGNVSTSQQNLSIQSVEELRARLQRMEEHLVTQQENQSLAQEEHMAVIREQESEIQKLKLDLERMNETCEDLESQLYRAFRVDSPASATSAARRQGKTERGTDFSNQDEEHEDADTVCMHNRSHDMVVKARRSSSVDSSTSVLSPGSESGSSSSDTFYNTSISQWREELIRHPTPHFDLDSPEVHYLLHSWTTNLQKLHYLRMWFTQVVTTRGPLVEDFPLGIELPRLLPEIRDGFLTLIVPLLRKQTHRDIHVHSRQYNDQFHTDLRIRVTPRRR